MPDDATQHMQCLEVWGGNQVVDSAVVMSGLDAWVYSRPYGKSTDGGDVYYVSSCATGRISRLLVADVTGHGSAVADTAGKLRWLMRRYVNYVDQGRFVQSMNQQFLTISQNGGFATALVTTFFAPTRTLSLCNAGHPAPLLYRAANRQWSVLKSAKEDESRVTNIPLGVMELDDYEQFDAPLELGDLVMCYTDSLTEARVAGGELLGESGLLEIMRSLDVSDPPRLQRELLEKIEALTPGNLDADDVTILMFRPNGRGARIPLAEKFRANVRMFKAMAAALKPGGPPFPWPEMSVANLGGAMLGRLHRARKEAARRRKARVG